ncbi:transcriptional regulator, TetR family [Agromyces sp. CF514]|uniref:TetR/AcrR family transcriptional regulator n=1 Tax=Agromyces sp. CF514 TaxID=1881031 RepID=UPI0008ECF398|nr:TetR/AcrR family transcriptional regulator [Agromyces sp. CF514]SFR91388.1 transcriptional regulator, TetR family [Agromyces sp. CF514]
MTDPTAPRARRRRNSLTEVEILDAAEAVAAGGFAALTMRAVADELGASPMALYRYFATKDDLVDALLDRVLGRIEFGDGSDGSGDPRADLDDFAHRHLALLLAHPWAVAPLVAHPLPGPNAFPIGEHALAILDRAGITGDDAVAVFSGILALNYGWASFAISRSEPDAASSMARLFAATAPGLPRTAAVAAEMQRYGSDDHYDRVVARLLHTVG